MRQEDGIEENLFSKTMKLSKLGRGYLVIRSKVRFKVKFKVTQYRISSPCRKSGPECGVWTQSRPKELNEMRYPGLV